MSGLCPNCGQLIPSVVGLSEAQMKLATVRNNYSSAVTDLLLAVEAAEDGVLLMSRRHCHARDVSSIVVGRQEEGRLLRAFLAWPGHQLGSNTLGGSLAVGIHDHRYSLDLKAIYGRVQNSVYARSTRGIQLNEWRFQTGSMTGQPVAKKIGCRLLSTIGHEVLSTERWTHLHALALHDIDCLGLAAWWVLEGPTVQEETSLFTRADTVKTEGLYETFASAEDVRQHVGMWAQLTEGRTETTNG